MYSNFFSTPIHAMSVLGGDLAAPEQRGIVSAAMGVATSVGVASGDSRRWTLGWHPGGKGENPGNPGEDAFLLTNFCLMFMESSKIFQYICRKNVLNMSLEVSGRCPRFFPEWGNVGDKRPGSLVVSNDSLQHHFDLKRSWIIELESTNWQYLVNLIYATSSMFHMCIYIYIYAFGTFPTGISHRRIKLRANWLKVKNRNMISIWQKAVWIENVWSFNVRTIVGRFPRASLGLADSFCCSTLDRFWKTFGTDLHKGFQRLENLMWFHLMMMMMSIADWMYIWYASSYQLFQLLVCLPCRGSVQ